MKGEQFIKLPREVLESAAFRSLGINGWRVLHFLMLEHMRRGGRQNGLLKAPYRQLTDFGIGAKYAAEAIAEAESSGLVECRRHGLRMATTYTLTWLPLHDRSAPTHSWRAYSPDEKPKNLHVKGDAALHVKGDADGPNLHVKGDADGPKNLHVKGDALYRSSYQGGEVISVAERVSEEVGTGARCRFFVAGAYGHRLCGKPAVDGERCTEHTRPASLVSQTEPRAHRRADVVRGGDYGQPAAPDDVPVRVVGAD